LTVVPATQAWPRQLASVAFATHRRG